MKYEWTNRNRSVAGRKSKYKFSAKSIRIYGKNFRNNKNQEVHMGHKWKIWFKWKKKNLKSGCTLNRDYTKKWTGLAHFFNLIIFQVFQRSLLIFKTQYTILRNISQNIGVPLSGIWTRNIYGVSIRRIWVVLPNSLRIFHSPDWIFDSEIIRKCALNSEKVIKFSQVAIVEHSSI